MKVIELARIIEQIAPNDPDVVWEKDNVGLLVGRPDAPVSRVMVALDFSLEVIEEARAWGAQVILAHHPLIFGNVNTVTDQTAAGRRVMALLSGDIAAICLHTNFDGAKGGLNDELARLLGLRDTRILVNKNGDYGRYGVLSENTSMSEFARLARRALNTPVLRYHDAGAPVYRVCVGSGGSGKLFQRALQAGCDTFLTGDVSHDVFCDARDMGLNIVDATHFATEDIMCDLLIRLLSARAARLEFKKADASRAPYEVL